MTEHTDFAELSAVAGDAAVIAELAEEAAAREPVTIVDGRVLGFVLRPGQRLEQIDVEKYEPVPARKSGTVAFTDPASLVTYVDRHSLKRCTTLWADEPAATVTAVLDDHAAHGDKDTEGSPGWGGHRAILRLRETDDWKHWLRNDGKLLGQDAFAEHIEDGVDAIRDPDAATMLEIAQTFHAKTGASFASSRHLSGEVQFTFEEQTTAKAGQRGTMEIPQQFVLGLAPFEGGNEYGVTARFRFRLADGRLSLGYRLIRPDKARRAAFADAIESIETGSQFPVMHGTPRQS